MDGTGVIARKGTYGGLIMFAVGALLSAGTLA
jgi:hypothetical protein